MDTQDLIQLLFDLDTTIDVELNEINPELDKRGLTGCGNRLIACRTQLRDTITHIVTKLEKQT